MKLNYIADLPRRPWLALGVLGVLGLARSAQAQEYNTGTAYNTGSKYDGGTFTNTASGTYTNTGSSALIYYAGPATGTFTNNGTYSAAAGATDQFIGPNGAAGSQEIAGSIRPTFNNLTLANGTAAGQVFTISNAAGILVNGTLTLNNGRTVAATTAQAIRMGASAPAVAGTLGAGAGYVDGYMSSAATSTYLYPLGSANGNTAGANPPTGAVGGVVYSPITFSNPNGTTARYVAGATPSNTGSNFDASQGTLSLKSVSRQEYYPISGATVAPASSSVTIPYGNFGPNGVGTPYVANTSTLTIAGYDGTQWVNLGTSGNTINTSAKTVQVALNRSLAGITMLALGSTDAVNPLPVQLKVFTATKKGADGLLTWTTVSETNSAYFEVQTSTDGSKWQTLGKVAAAGNSVTPRDYAFTDKEIARYGAPLVYYRLNQVDQDGKAALSPVRTLTPDALAWSVSAYPNPFATELAATLTTGEAGPVTLALYDVTGKVVLNQTLTATAGSQVIDLRQAATVATGQYLLRVQQGTHAGTVRLTKE